MAASTDTSTTASTTAAATLTQTTTARVATYSNFVSPDVAAATNGLKDQLENGAKNRLKFTS